MEHKSLSKRLHIDFILIVGLMMICGLGLFVIYSATGENEQVVYKQLIRLSIAFVCMILVAQIPITTIQRWAPAMYSFGIVLLIAVLLFGDSGKGAQRWLELGFIRFQPSEIMKLAVPIAVAWFFVDKTIPPNFLKIAQSLIIIFLPVLLIARQPDLGTAVLVAVAGLSILFVAGISWKILGGFFLLSLPGSYLLWSLMHGYQKQRVLTFLDPEKDPLGSGYHIIQSKIAIGSGGLYGKGWLNGTQSHLEFLPERTTDFIFAVFCEEFGFIGVLFLISVYLLMIVRGLFITINAQETFGKLLGSGIILTFFVYVFVNIGMVTGQLPVVGVPLPLVSYGGSSMVTLMIGFGLLMSIDTHKRLLS